jgi:NAD(P)-dependent dehydrogenase (short-subunit alcohol dehydrogenase family)
MMLSPQGRVVMVSGASRGIGRAIAERLLAAGYAVSAGVRDPAKLPFAGERVLACRYDAKDRAAPPAWVAATMARFGRIDGLVNSAGINPLVRVMDEDEAPLDEMWTVNVKGPLRLVRAALPHLEASGTGRIINIASLSGKRVKNESNGYAMTKFAVVALTHSIRRLGWDKGVRATALCPSFVKTDMTAQYYAKVPPEQMTQPEDLAALVETVMALPNNAVVAELLVNCRLEEML